MHWSSRGNKGVIRIEFFAEVKALFEIRLTRSQLSSDREITAPGSTSFLHTYVEFLFEILRKETSTHVFELHLKLLIDVMSDDVKEA